MSVCAYLFVCVCAYSISCVNPQLIASHRGNISHLHTDARPPSVNDCEIEVAVATERTVTEWK